MRVWRISPSKYASTCLQGIGGLYVSGRWHHRGQPVVYTSATPSLAALEVLVHVDVALIPLDLRLVEIEVPDELTTEVCDPETLAKCWWLYPGPVELQTFGSTWLAERRTPVLDVPSAVLPIERNYVLNPAHPHAAQFRIVQEQPFAFDQRLLT